MLGSIHILSAGLTTIQDEGRYGYTAEGVPISGAWNQQRYRICRELIYGEPSTTPQPVFELLGGTLSLIATHNTLLVTVGEAHVSLEEHTMPTSTVLFLVRGEQVSITHAGKGPVYVGVAGFRPSAITLGSYSWDTLSHLGSPPVQKGDTYPFDTASPQFDRVGDFNHSPLPHTHPQSLYRILPHNEHYSEVLFRKQWRVKEQSRIGIRLDECGNEPEGTGFPFIPSTAPSYPTVRGLIQLPPNSEPIILGPDAGTAGGYATIGVITTVDFPRLADLRAGDRVSFTETAPEEAIQAYETCEQGSMFTTVRVASL